jgi:hypothetical protein
MYDNIRSELKKLSTLVPDRIKLIFADGTVELAAPGERALPWLMKRLEDCRTSTKVAARYASIVDGGNCGRLHELLRVAAIGPMETAPGLAPSRARSGRLH